MKVVVDTNVLVSSFLLSNSNPAKIIDLWKNQMFDILVSSEILDEYIKVLNYDKIRKLHKLEGKEINRFINTLKIYSKFTELTERQSIIKDDPDEDKCIWTVIDGGAEYIISGDVHLLSLEEYNGIYIISQAAFLSLF